MADPGFPIGGHGPHRGALTPKVAMFHKNLYVKMKELGPLGGHTLGASPPKSANEKVSSLDFS